MIGYEVAADISGEDLETNRYYYTHDEQGSTVFITDKEQQIKNEYCYDAFGNVLDSKDEVHNRITYVGQQFDGITNQYYLRARFYNPVIGRFTQDDVYRGDGLDLYSYCGSNPVAYYDPSGYMECESKVQPSINSRMNERAGIKFSARVENSPLKKGGYKTNDIDKYKKNGPGKNHAIGYSYSKIDGKIESHHPIQNEWAKQWAKTNNIVGYGTGRNAPGILIKSNAGEVHAKLSGLQKSRRNLEGFNTDITHEFNIGYKEMLEAGIVPKHAKRLLGRHIDILIV
nr:RHS repeat-associated core domain-containing protein [Clostridium estertheticum]